MSDFFTRWGRKLGKAAAPTVRKSKWIWQSMAGSEEDSLQAEVEFGRAIALELRQRLGRNGEPDADDELVAEIGRRLSQAQEDTARSFQVELIQGGDPSALAVPGGFIFLDMALLEFCQRQPDELAFVIGHEMAHLIHHHTLERLISQVGVDMISTLVGRGALKVWMRQAGTRLLQTAHSKGCELDADETGAMLALKAGYEPRAALSLLRRIQAFRESTEEVGEYFGSHPSEQVRIDNLKSGGRQ